ncbi:MAG TPA: hypothetical protein VF509_07595 [Sphingobium sp.]
MIEVSIDERTGIIRTVGTGRWTAEEVDAHFMKLGDIISDVRRRGQVVRILSDVSGAEVQSPAIEARINALSGKLRQPGDRSALVVKSSLLKVHVREVADCQDLALFCSAAAAETWLLAHDLSISA